MNQSPFHRRISLKMVGVQSRISGRKGNSHISEAGDQQRDAGE
jgi:hypothetical protein